MTRLGDALYRVVLIAFPRQFRRHHGEAMAAQFRARREALAGRPVALAALWTRAMGDALWHGISVRRERRLDGSRLSRLPGERFRQDLRFAWRGIVRDRGVTAVVVLTLTLGIAANAVMFGLVDRLLFQAPQGVGHPELVRRVYFGSERDANAIGERESYPATAAIRDRVPAFASAAVTFRQPVTIGGGADAREATIELANADYFSLLELSPAAGRFYTRDEDAVPDGAGAVVLSHAFWTRHFGGDPRAIGAGIRIEGKPLTIVGVAPSRFSGLDREAVDLWAPPASLGRELIGPRWQDNFFRYGFGLVARLTQGSADELATQQATAAYRSSATPEAAAMLDERRTAFTARLDGMSDPYGVAPEGKVSAWLLGVAAVVLLTAIANVAHLLLTRAFARRREIAVRLAVGIGRPRLLRQLLTESALLTTVAVGIALAVAYLGGRAVQQVFMPGLAVDVSVIDLRALAVTFVLAALTSLGVGLAPAWYALSTDLTDSLRSSTRSTARHGGMLRAALLVTQVALSVVLLVGAGLF
ncbi:MAG TPA: ABC transporter permease, partial [Vicinamibacterales bacterium]|nr:ABC transporter permease [Vicinamibacterales bacterium]